MPYKQLNPEHISCTLETLHARVEERFPDRGLLNVCGELLTLSETHVEQAALAARPLILLRAASIAVIVIGVTAVAWLVWQKVRLFGMNPDEFNSFEGVEAIVNMLLLMGAGVWFLATLETRVRRERVLENLHQLRSIAHVIDMHQLTKDPTSFRGARPTKSSPARDMSPYELMRYLDYCAEMLSLTGKLAALYMQGLRDPVVIQAVNEIEELTTNLSRKIWQKIMILGPEVPAVPKVARHHAAIQPVAAENTTTDTSKEFPQ
ncbi:MAG: hypothetical protein AAFY43_01180 [Pseudomonadota bacterium]